MRGSYYNEIDPFAAEMLRNLIKAGLIAPGDVDERSIEDVRPDDLRGYAQCHFFAGVGVWSYALRRAGWPDARPVWTGSCPCQPFSTAGKGAGFADERHLWPHFHWLIEQCRPPIVLGEQVASKDGLAWLDLVSADLEGSGYTSGAVDTCAAGFGAPHIRQRLYWVAHAHDEGLEGRCGMQERADQLPAGPSSVVGGLADPGGAGQLPGALAGVHRRQEGAGARHGESERHGATCGLADADGGLSQQGGSVVRGWPDGSDAQPRPGLGGGGVLGGLGDAQRAGLEGYPGHGDGALGRQEQVGSAAKAGSAGGLANPADQRQHGRGAGEASDGRYASRVEPERLCNAGFGRPGPTNGLWRNADWLFCRDGKWRPVSPKPQPLVDGSAESLGRVRPGIIKEVEEEINAWAVESQIDGNQALRDLLVHLGAEAQRCWEAGRIPGLHEAPFLLAFLRQLTEQGWRISERLPVSCQEVAEAGMRSVRRDDGPTGASYKHRLEGQQAGERTDPMLVLSSLLARHAQAAWDNAHAAYAETAFPLALGARSRVGRLRAYGNSINTAQAEGFIRAVMG